MGTRRSQVERTRLLGLLADRHVTRVTLIEGGAGVGKSTLIAQSLAASPVNRPGWERIVECGRPIGGAIGPDELAKLVALAIGAPSSEFRSIVDEFLIAAPNQAVLWFDDAHRLHASCTRWLDELIDSLPGNGHVVLAGRSLPSIRTRRLQLAGQVMRIDQDQLCFDDDERAVFRHLRRLDDDRSERWPALAELRASSGADGALEYLTEEVLGSIDPERRRLLAGLTSLDSIDTRHVSALTQHLTGEVVDPATVDLEVLTKDLPFIRMADDGSVRFHDLVRDALRATLDRATAYELDVVIAAEFLRRGDASAAVRRFAALGDESGVAAAAQHLIEDIHTTAEPAVVELVGRVLGDDPLATTLEAVSLAISAPSIAVPALRAAVDAAVARGRTDLETFARLRLAEIGYSGDSTLVSESAVRIDELASSGERAARRLWFIPHYYRARMTGQTESVPESMRTVLATEDLPFHERAVAEFYRVISLGYTGRAQQAFAESTRLADELPDGLFRNRIGGVLATLRWQLGVQTDDDLRAVRALVDDIEAAGQMQLFVEGAAATAIFHATVGEVDAARSLARRAADSLPTIGERGWSGHTVAQALAVLDVIDGDEASAARRLEESVPPGGPFDGIPSHAYFFAAPLVYLLVPRTRSAWDACPVEPDLTLRTRVGQALVAFRERGDLAFAASLPWHRPAQLRPFAPGPLLAELAVAAVAGGSTDAADVIEQSTGDAAVTFERLRDADDDAVAAAATTAITVTPRRPTCSIDISWLGPLEVRRDGVDESNDGAWRSTRTQRLLALLVHDRRIPRLQAAETLWPDADPPTSANSLRVALSKLTEAFEPGRERHRPGWFVRTDGDDLVLAVTDELSLDVDRFREHAANAERLDTTAPRQALQEHLAAVELFRGGYLHGVTLPAGGEQRWYYEQLRLQSAFVRSAVRSAVLSLAMGDDDRAIALATRACEVESLHEGAHRVLADALLHQRRVGAARDVLGSLLLGLRAARVAPEPETNHLATRLDLHR